MYPQYPFLPAGVSASVFSTLVFSEQIALVVMLVIHDMTRPFHDSLDENAASKENQLMTTTTEVTELSAAEAMVLNVSCK